MKFNLQSISQFPFPLRFLVFLICLALPWAPVALPLYFWLRADANLSTVAVMGTLFIIFLGVLSFWSRSLYGVRGWGYYGLVGTRRNCQEWLQGIGLGLLFTASLFITEVGLGWATFLPLNPNLVKIIGEGSLTGLGVGFAEELFFRGWLLTELERDYSLSLALGLNGGLFAACHFLKPLPEILRTAPQFLGLLALGLILVGAKRHHGDRLGMSMGLHGGLVWGYYIFNVGQLVGYTQRVPTWITGIDGNPLAGLLGLAWLLLLALWLRVFRS